VQYSRLKKAFTPGLIYLVDICGMLGVYVGVRMVERMMERMRMIRM